jgi:signal transduction histidine kinase/DNA-binding response OmpR family regulator
LEGFDTKWNYIGNKHEAIYTNLNPGNYVFKVKASNNNDDWNEAGISLPITILPPFWRTWWAYSLFFFLILAILYLFRHYSLSKERLKNLAEIEHLNAEKEREMSQLKLQFFTNVSHEFRTPLTLIAGPLNKLMAGWNDLSREKMAAQFDLMQRNVSLLERLTDQLLDFRKIETGRMKLMVTQGDLAAFIKTITLGFSQLAGRKQIHLSFSSEPQILETWFDADKIEKILNNLLSNAIKFTPEHGSVSVSIRLINRTDRCIEVTIADTGFGIEPAHLSAIFNPFYQVPDSRKYRIKGTGVGLALTRELVELHFGQIRVESEVNKGSRFIFSIPFGKENYSDDQIGNDDSTPSQSRVWEEGPEIASYKTHNDIVTIEGPAGDKSSVLIVEDNDDLRMYLADSLATDFIIYTASNGAEGLKLTGEKMPDLVISDVMMPEMDGMQLVNQLKTDIKTSHIPIILLTAIHSTDNKLTGWNLGADEYLTKPFNEDILKVRVHNLIDNRVRIQQRFKQSLSLEPGEIASSPVDEKLLKRILEITEKHMDNCDFTVDILIEELGTMSRSQFYRKINSIIGQSPNEFILSIRLKRAAQLLKTKQYNVSEVAYMVGFKQPRNFSKCFHQQFGILPGVYSKGL